MTNSKAKTQNNGNVKMFVVNNNNEDDNPKKNFGEIIFFFNVSRVLFLTQPSPTQI